MIDTKSEETFSLTEAAKRLPHRRGGKRPHVSCLYRWSTDGCRGIVLETIQIGGTRCTSAEAMQRFFDKLSLKPTEVAKPEPIRTVTDRMSASEHAARVLEQLGV